MVYYVYKNLNNHLYLLLSIQHNPKKTKLTNIAILKIMKENKPNKIKTLPITNLEKIVLKNRILKSVDNISKQKKRSHIYYGAAACVILLVGFSFSFFRTPSSSITDFIDASKTVNINESSNVVLILGEGENLNIKEESSIINYSNSGQKVTIGNSKEVNQKTSKNNKTVYNTLLVPYGKRSNIQLSDGTLVWLNSGSKLVYPAVFNGNKRELYLEGEAIFDVAHIKNKPFIVISEDQEVEVLGTVFGITNYKDENAINTVLKTGSVQISYNKNASTNLLDDKMKISPGTKASYNKKTMSIISEKVNVDQYFSWKEGVLVFKNDDLRYITKRISRYYNIEIEITDENLAIETFSGYLDLNENIDSVIKNIKASTNMNYTFSENKIIIN